MGKLKADCFATESFATGGSEPPSPVSPAVWNRTVGFVSTFDAANKKSQGKGNKLKPLGVLIPIMQIILLTEPTVVKY